MVAPLFATPAIRPLGTCTSRSKLRQDDPSSAAAIRRPWLYPILRYLLPCGRSLRTARPLPLAVPLPTPTLHFVRGWAPAPPLGCSAGTKEHGPGETKLGGEDQLNRGDFLRSGVVETDSTISAFP